MCCIDCELRRNTNSESIFIMENSQLSCCSKTNIYSLLIQIAFHIGFSFLYHIFKQLQNIYRYIQTVILFSCLLKGIAVFFFGLFTKYRVVTFQIIGPVVQSRPTPSRCNKRPFIFLDKCEEEKHSYIPQSSKFLVTEKEVIRGKVIWN